jgi:hypothetical protein
MTQHTYSIQRQPSQGKHPLWLVLIDGILLCACAYRKGAEALVSYLKAN